LERSPIERRQQRLGDDLSVTRKFCNLRPIEPFAKHEPGVPKKEMDGARPDRNGSLNPGHRRIRAIDGAQMPSQRLDKGRHAGEGLICAD
jgi:hypothetical protein